MTTPIEVSWFAALCDDDYEFLGVPNPDLESSWAHCRDIVLAADRNGYDNVLLPSGYELGIDTLAFAGGIAALAQQIHLLVAVRIGEVWLPQLARQLATLNQMAGGRLTINIISSDMPGESLESAPRYERTLEYMHGLRTLLNGEHLEVRGRFVDFDIDAPRIARDNPGCPPMYFGGFSDAAKDTAAEAADVFLTWPDAVASVGDTVADMRIRASRFNRTLRYGLRTHIIVRETEDEARSAAERLVSKLDATTGTSIRGKSLDTASVGVSRQTQLRTESDNDGYAEDNLWTGIGRARSGAGAAIVGNPDQVIAKLMAYQDVGIEAFILSGYPHIAECDLFAHYVLPAIAYSLLKPRWV